MENLEFESLVPTSEMDENKKTFIEALRWATSKPDNKNIAITGTYGAGKSSLIETFIKEEKIENETVKISIATFNKESINDAPPSVNSEVPIENILEQQILQQLFYKIDPNKIPLSQFTRFLDLNRRQTISTILFILSMSLITYSIFKFDWLTKAYKGLTSGDLNKVVLVTVIGLFLIILYSYYIYICILIFQKMGLSKFGLGNTSIEVVTKESNTVFNRYLDEIIYLFKQSRYKYVIFEDLDRFDNIGIYERLKGLNIILNGTKQLSGHNIVFIYALKDDLFISNDGKDEIYNRTKFFDFIIPTIKIVHSSNAENLLTVKLKSELESETNTIGISKAFIEDISLFVNDMRTLINICNEYKIYKSALLNGGITANNLFAFIVYKNIYPSDYSNLLNNQGKLYDFLNIKHEVANNLNKEIDSLKQKISLEIISEDFYSEDIEYLFYQKGNYDQQTSIIEVIDTQDNIVEKITRNDGYYTKIKFGGLFDACLNLYEEGFKLRAIYSNGVYKHYGMEFFDNPGRLNFLERYRLVKSKENQTSIKRTLNILTNRLQKIKTKSISSLLEINLLNCSLLSEIKVKDELLYFLVRHGWVDESYEDYLSYFYEGSLSNNDVKMLKSVRNNLPSDYSLALRNTHKVWGKIRIEDIQAPAIFNYDLLGELLIRPSSYSGKLQKFIGIMFNTDEDNEQGIPFYFDFVEYLNQRGQYEEIYNLLHEIDKYGLDFIVDVSKDDNWEDIPTNYINVLINSWRNISNLFKPNLASTDEAHALRETRVSTMRNIINLMNPNHLFKNSNLEKNKALLEDLNIQFTDITSVENDEYKNLLIEGHYFGINKSNLESIIGKINYATALSNSAIEQYIIDNKIYFLEKVILNLENYEEDEKIFIQILNDDDIGGELKGKLIEKCSIRIENIENLNSIKNILLSNKVVCNLNNILTIIEHDDYFEEDVNLDLLFNKQENIHEFLINLNDNNITLQNKLSIEIIKSKYITTEQLNEIFEHSERYIVLSSSVLENIHENSKKNILEQIKLERIYWSKALYKLLCDLKVDPNIVSQYVVTAIESSPTNLTSDLINLIDDQELIWIEEVVEVIVNEQAHLEAYFKQFSLEVSQEYFFSKINSLIPFVSDLNHSWSTTEMNNAYFIKSVEYGVNNAFLDKQIEEIDIWDIVVFEALRKKHSTYAIYYAKKFEKDLKNIIITQDILNVFVTANFNGEIITNLYNFNELSPSTELLTWLLEESNMQYFDKLYNKIEVLNSYSQHENISKIVLWYIKTKRIFKPEVYKLLTELKKPFSEIGIRKGDNKEVEYDPNTHSLLKYLMAIGVIASINKTESNTIKFNNKRK